MKLHINIETASHYSFMYGFVVIMMGDILRVKDQVLLLISRMRFFKNVKLSSSSSSSHNQHWFSSHRIATPVWKDSVQFEAAIKAASLN